MGVFSPASRLGCKLLDLSIKQVKSYTLIKSLLLYLKDNYDKDIKTLLDIISKYKIEIIAIENGTASRESEAFIAKLIQEHHLNVEFAIISETSTSILFQWSNC